MTLALTLLLKSTVLFVLCGLFLLCLRRASASARHLVCLLTLGALLALPLFSVALPGWRLPVLQEPTPSQAPALPKREGEESRPSAAAAGSSAGETSPRIAAPSAAAAKNSSSSRFSTGYPEGGRTPAKQGGGFFILYLLGVLLAAVRPLLGLWGITHLRRICIPAADTLTLGLAEECAAALGLKRRPQTCRADVPVPMTWGGLRPVIALPSASTEWPEDRLQAVLLHEMAHVVRRDWPGHRLADLACALYWFHPCVWLVARRLRAESEIACDDLVVSSGVPAAEYARHLLEIAQSLPGASHPPHSAIAMAQTSRIERRLTMILDKAQNRRAIARRVLLFALVPSTAALVTLAVLRPTVNAQAAADAPNGSTPSGLQFSGTTFLQINHKAGPGQVSFNTSSDLKINGTTLLAGITNDTKPSGPWWNYSGIPLSKPLYQTAFDHPVAVTGAKGVRSLVFAFRLPQEARDFTTVFEAPNSVISSSAGQWIGKTQGQGNATEAMLNRTTGGTRTLEAVYPASVAKASLRVGIGAGPWKVAASRKVSQNEINFRITSRTFVVGEPVKTAKGYSLTVSTDSSDDLRIVYVDGYGHEFLPNLIGGESVNKLDQITAQFNLPLSQIKEFRVETRPFQWVEFKDVALQPAK